MLKNSRTVFPCGEYVYEHMPEINIRLTSDDETMYQFTSREYIVEIPIKKEDFTGSPRKIRDEKRDSKVTAEQMCSLAIRPSEDTDQNKWIIGATFAKRYTMEVILSDQSGILEFKLMSKKKLDQ